MITQTLTRLSFSSIVWVVVGACEDKEHLLNHVFCNYQHCVFKLTKICRRNRHAMGARLEILSLDKDYIACSSLV